jgi:cytochrome c oxidase subunit I+III
MDAEPDHRKEFPEPTVWPFLTAVALGGLYVGSIFTPWAVVWGAVPTTIGLVGWAWPRKGKEPRRLVQHLAHRQQAATEQA